METKLKLKGTVCTNGLALHALAYDTSVLRPKAAREAADDDGIDKDNEQDHIDDAFLDIEDIINDIDLDSLDQVDMGSSMEGTDVQEHGGPTEVASQYVYKGYVINWRQGSKLLENLEVPRG
ncbi:hypothetical protein BGX31_008143 [Mortierella sp. GBA43]|nr:hypothetical protein BGX31_008143 [Mortierella sp. GBA43]